MDLTRVASWAASTPWAINQEKLRAIAIALALRVHGAQPDADRIQSAKARRRHGMATLLSADGVKAAYKGQIAETKSIAILPIYGTICPRMHMMEDGSGGISCERIGLWINQAANDPKIGGIVLDMDTPGGSVSGVDELANKIRAAAQQKPILAVANYDCCSAGYYLAAAASEIGMSRTSVLGSVGVYMIHQCFADALAKEGIETTMIQAGEFKLVGNPFQPLSEAAAQKLQEWVDRSYSMFISSVAKHRGKSEEHARNKFGKGWIVPAEEAKAVGMVDSIGTFDELLDDFSSRVLKPSKSSAARAQQDMDLMQRELQLAAVRL